MFVFDISFNVWTWKAPKRGGKGPVVAGKKKPVKNKLSLTNYPFKSNSIILGFAYFVMVFVYVVICLGEGAESIVREEAEAVWNWRGFATKEGSEPIR